LLIPAARIAGKHRNAMSEKKKKSSKPSVQRYLPIAEIRDDTFVTKEGKLVGAFLVSSINFALKSEEEQEAIIYSYVRFLNSIDFPLQVLIQSRELDMDAYLSELERRRREQTNELLRAQIADYRSFIAELVSLGKIMSKHFFVVVPYDPLSNKKKSFWARASEVFNPAMLVRLKEERFNKRKKELDMRVRQIDNGLRGMNMEIVRLDTQSLIELYFAAYNTDIALSEELPPLNQLQVEG